MNFSKKATLTLIFSLLSVAALAKKKDQAAVASIRPGDLVEFDYQPQAVKNLICQSLDLTQKNLAYTYGSNSPEKGGMDCSGTICHVLKQQNINDVPRMAHTIYLWLEAKGNLHKISRVHDPADPALGQLQPGDLLFWEGTYAVKDRNPPISHVMLYLGTLKSDGRGVLFGASSGRSYRGKRIHGVSVFDFSVPSEKSTSKLVGYGSIPGIRPVNSPPHEESEGETLKKKGSGPVPPLVRQTPVPSL